MLEIPWLNTIVSAFTLLVLFLVVFIHVGNKLYLWHLYW